MSWSRASLALILGLVSLASCSSSTGDKSAQSACPPIAIDRFKELVIVDGRVTDDARAKNATDGPWSFRHMIEELAGPNGDTSAFLTDWLNLYTLPRNVGGFLTSSRKDVEPNVVCPWLRQRAENACDEGCTSCTERKLDLSAAPFRLIAIVNRFDLHLKDGGGGEARFVYGLMDGPADTPGVHARDMSLNFEFRLPTDRDRGEGYWARRWHELGSFKDFDEDFRAHLEGITSEFAHRESLGQVRTNERVLDWDWQLREFKLEGASLVLSPTQDTPDKSLNDSKTLHDFVVNNSDAILKNEHHLPSALAGGEAVANVKWVIPEISEQLRSAFARETCNGCHQTEQAPVDFNFHISPLRTGIDRLSAFLNNPSDPEHDDLARRTAVMQQSSCK